MSRGSSVGNGNAHHDERSERAQPAQVAEVSACFNKQYLITHVVIKPVLTLYRTSVRTVLLTLSKSKRSEEARISSENMESYVMNGLLRVASSQHIEAAMSASETTAADKLK